MKDNKYNKLCTVKKELYIEKLLNSTVIKQL